MEFDVDHQVMGTGLLSDVKRQFPKLRVFLFGPQANAHRAVD